MGMTGLAAYILVSGVKALTHFLFQVENGVHLKIKKKKTV